MIDEQDVGNDDSYPTSPRQPVPDPYGQAALLLAESILHSLVDQRVLTSEQAAAAVRSASEVKVEVAAELHEPHAAMERSLGLLRRIESSLLLELPDDEPQ